MQTDPFEWWRGLAHVTQLRRLDDGGFQRNILVFALRHVYNSRDFAAIALAAIAAGCFALLR